jgi:nitrogen regulatory protein P-II 2
MKLVSAIISRDELDDICETLSDVGITGLTATEVKGFGRQKGHVEIYRGAEHSVNFVPEFRIDVAIADEQLSTVVETIVKGTRAEIVGDGKIFVVHLPDAVRIRTSETNVDAL